jgi:alpha,alpha-trehalase
MATAMTDRVSRVRRLRAGAAALTALCLLCLMAAAAVQVATPAELYGELFERVQLEGVYPDSKTFVDAVPVRPPAQVLDEYHAARERPGFDLKKFVAEHFTPPASEAAAYRTVPGQSVREHIDHLWSVLERKPEEQRPYSSRLPLPFRYIVPGGRFNEIYYWDSYFTMLGLEESGRHDLTEAMLRNFAYLIDEYGHVPNGNRSYYLSRSQPPFFAAMVELVAARDGEQTYREFLPQLEREYRFWMDGAAGLAPGAAHRRVVRLSDGAVLNRYWDDRDTPREEAYREDIATARASQRAAADVYRNLRAAAESGWDFSSRWFADGRTRATIRTTELIPPDLNSLMYQLELTIAHAREVSGDSAGARDMRQRAAVRKEAILRHLWNADTGAFADYDWRARELSSQVTAATLYPLYFRVADQVQARTVATTTRTKLLQPHGLAPTTVFSGEQWDPPNGWAPLQWIAIAGLRNYGNDQLAAVIAQRWVGKNLQVFRDTGKLVEKYDVIDDAAGGGGEYPLQDGFGWTNGVLRKLLTMYPALLPRTPPEPVASPATRTHSAHGMLVVYRRCECSSASPPRWSPAGAPQGTRSIASHSARSSSSMSP